MTSGLTPPILAGLALQTGNALPLGMDDLIGSTLGIGAATQMKVIWSGIAILLLVLLRRLVIRVVERRVESAKARYQWAKSSAYVAFVLGLLTVSQIWLEAIQGFGTFLGLLSAGLAIALRDVVANLAGWSFILWRRPFELGDRIQVGEYAGDVVDLRIFQFTVLEIGNWVGADQSTGRVIHVPNARVFTEPLANYTVEFPYVWHEIPVLVTFESDWRKAKRILLEVVDEVAGPVVAEAKGAVKRASRKFLIHYRHVTPIVYTSVQDSGVLLTLRFLCPARGRRGMAEGIWEKVLDAFHQEDGVDFAYPTHRVYHNLLEGKEGARSEPPGWLRGVDAGPRGAGADGSASGRSNLPHERPGAASEEP